MDSSTVPNWLAGRPASTKYPPYSLFSLAEEELGGDQGRILFFKTWGGRFTMVNNSEIGAYEYREIGNLICSRHLIRSTTRKIILKKPVLLHIRETRFGAFFCFLPLD